MPVSTVDSTTQGVLACEAVIRRVISARVRDPHDVDDLVHDCLERLLAAKERLAPDAVLPFAVVTARHLVISRARRIDRASAPRRRREIRASDDPEDAALAAESREALAAALGTLSPGERADLLAYQLEGARAHGESPGAVRVRMARTRAKLRLEYLVALRRVELPTTTCRRVLLAVSSGDTRRQHALGAGDHLLDCATCAELCAPLEQRSLALTIVAFPLVALAWVLAKAKAHPALSAAAGAVVVAVAVAALAVSIGRTPARRTPAGTPPVVGPPSTPVPVGPPAPVASSPTRPLAVTGLTAGDAAVRAGSSLRSEAGRPVLADDVEVEQVVTHDGFWVGSSRTTRVWVELVGPLRSFRVRDGDLVRFAGTVVADDDDYALRAGVSDATGAALLLSERAHIAATTTSLTVTGRR